MGIWKKESLIIFSSAYWLLLLISVNYSFISSLQSLLNFHEQFIGILFLSKSSIIFQIIRPSLQSIDILFIYLVLLIIWFH